jgi:hypothetical protein
MSETDQDWNDALDRTHEAVRQFARSEFGALTRKVIYRLRRFPASGIYGSEKHKTLWDEYCYEQNMGPSDPQIVTAWNGTLSPHFQEVIESIPAPTAILLSIYSIWDLDASLELCGSIWQDGMKEVLEKSLIDQATKTNKNYSEETP